MTRSRADGAPAWLYLPALPAPGQRCRLADEDRHYLRRVVRARTGEVLHATDGRGGMAELRLASEDEVLGVTTVHAPRTTAAWVLCGAPEGERADWMVEKLAELGIAVLQPIDTARDAWSGAARRLDRWRRLAVAALRQSCGRHLLEVRPPAPLAEALAGLPVGADRMLTDPAGGPLPGTGARAGVSVAAVGPAGGFTPEERDTVLGAHSSPRGDGGHRLGRVVGRRRS